MFLVAAAGYLVAAGILTLKYNIIFGDSMSRVANAHFVLFSRDPHLSAIGFVWNPLPSALMLPFVPLKYLLPVLVERAFLSNIESALFMAGAVYALHGILADLGARRIARLALSLLFALHPLILLYAANGMSEAPLLCFLLLAARALSRWALNEEPKQLVAAGVALALAYLSRYGAIGSGAAAMTLVFVVTLLRTQGSWRSRRAAALTDTAVVGTPLAATMILWAVVSKVIVGEWLPQLSGAYSFSGQVNRLGTEIRSVIGEDMGERAAYLARQWLGLQPLALVAALLVAVIALRRRDLRAVPLLCVLGANLAFDAYAFLSGKSFGVIRYSISFVPLTIVLAGLILATPPGTARESLADVPRRVAQRRLALPAAALAMVGVLLMVPGLFTGASTLLDRELAYEDSQKLMGVFRPERAEVADRAALEGVNVERRLARYLDRKRLPRGSVIHDTASSAAIPLNSRRPTQFVVTSDRDFERAVADPALFQVQYLVVPTQQVSFNALNNAYPDLYEKGAGIAVLEKEFKTAGYGPDWRIYRLNQAADSGAPGTPDPRQSGS